MRENKSASQYSNEITIDITRQSQIMHVFNWWYQLNITDRVGWEVVEILTDSTTFKTVLVGLG